MPEQYYGISCVYLTTLNYQIIKNELLIDLFIYKKLPVLIIRL